MAVSGRALSPALDTFEILAYRSAIGVFTVVVCILIMGNRSAFQPRAMRLHFGRNVAHFLGQNLWLYALTLIPLAQLFALEFSYPILVALGAALFMGERLSPLRVVTSIVGFIGVLVVAQPFGEATVGLGLIAAIACAFGFAGSALFTKQLTQKARVSASAVLFWLSVMQLGMGVVCAMLDGHMAWPDAALLPWLIVYALAGLGAHLSLTMALSLAPAAVVIPIDFLRLPLIAIIGALFYAEHTGLATYLGALLIFGANYVNILTEKRASLR